MLLAPACRCPAGTDGTHRALGVAVLDATSTGVARITVFAGGPGLVAKFGLPPPTRHPSDGREFPPHRPAPPRRRDRDRDRVTVVSPMYQIRQKPTIVANMVITDTGQISARQGRPDRSGFFEDLSWYDRPGLEPRKSTRRWWALAKHLMSWYTGLIARAAVRLVG
jgi:hypothetical protein